MEFMVQVPQEESAPMNPAGLHVRVASSFVARARGLLFRATLGFDEGLLIAPCSSVHTFGMRQGIDVVFVDPLGGVLRVVPSLGPWRMASEGGSAGVLELASGAAAYWGIASGVVLEDLQQALVPRSWFAPLSRRSPEES